MARGPVPKQRGRRARRNLPARGDWTSLAPLDKPVLPGLPKRSRGDGAWSSRTRRVWTAWRNDSVTGAYGPADIAMAIELAYLYEDAVRDPRPARWSEARQWMDRLGLTMKGKRDLRLQLADDPRPHTESKVEREADQVRRDERRRRLLGLTASDHLRLVDDDAQS